MGTAATDIDYQVKIMKTLRNYCTKTGMVVILIHHFNKGNKEYAGSAKIKDLCNVTIMIFPASDCFGETYRRFHLSKDKPHTDTPDCHCYYELGNYREVPFSHREG